MSTYHHPEVDFVTLPTLSFKMPFCPPLSFLTSFLSSPIVRRNNAANRRVVNNSFGDGSAPEVHCCLEVGRMSTLSSEPYRYEPTVQDILNVRSYFLLLRTPLPTQLVDTILDEAGYWAHSTVTVEYPACANASNWDSADHMYMRTLPLAIPGTEGDFVFSPQEPKQIRLGTGPDLSLYHRLHPCRRIVYDLWSHDQGWSSSPSKWHRTYWRSYSWWDASVETPQLDITSNSYISWPSLLVFADAKELEATMDVSPMQFHQREQVRPHIPAGRVLQRNLHAVYETRHHTVEQSHVDGVTSVEAQRALENRGRGWLSADGNFVRNLKVGDCIVLWISARFPGWAMHAEKAKISVYWAV
ncbi:hypothetical protein EDC04DRAFT_3149938 [Pisolithus marmoratus]|nr:hypothetical protein EDC04DRAFT_3149938 [Pisolithus marmoratus]